MNPIAIPVRDNSSDVTASWWNVIRTCLIAFFGGGSIPETAFVIANNQAAAADVTGLLFVSGSYRSYIVDVDIKRTGVRAVGFVMFTHDGASTWTKAGEFIAGDDHGITFSCTTGGQVQYQSTNTTAGTLRARARSFNV